MAGDSDNRSFDCHGSAPYDASDGSVIGVQDHLNRLILASTYTIIYAADVMITVSQNFKTLQI